MKGNLMKTCAGKQIILAFAFLCISFSFPPAYAAATTQDQKQQAHAAKAQPSIEVKDPDYNFGEITEGSEIEHEFTVHNAGKEVLKIDRVRVE